MENLEQSGLDSNNTEQFETEEQVLDNARALAEQMRNGGSTDESTPPSTEGEKTPEGTTVPDEEKTGDVVITGSENTEGNQDADTTGAESTGETTPPAFNPVKLKDRDLEIEVTSLDELMKLAEKGLNFTRKTQDLASHRPISEYAKQHGLSIEDLQMLTDIKSGKTEALAALAKNHGIDIMDVDADSKYTVSDNARYVEASDVDKVAFELSQNPELYGKVKTALTYVPQDFANQVVTDAELLTALRDDIASGIAERIIPEAVKRHAIYGGDFVRHYAQVDAELQQAASQAQPASKPTIAATPSADADPVSKAKAGIQTSTSGSEAESEDIWEPGISEAELLRRVQREANKMKG